MYKIISGGQTGADQAGLYAARDSGFETGGTAPQGFRTQGGKAPELADFGLVEHRQWAYQPRTEANVADSDVTFRLAHNFRSPGEKLTLRLCNKHMKPCFDIDFNKLPNPYIIAQYIITNNYKVINIAGNSDGAKNDGHFDACYEFLMKVFKELNK